MISLIAGLVIHSFIIGVNVKDWRKGRSLTPVDQVVTCLEISRMCIQFTETLYFFMTKAFPINPYLYVTMVIFTIYDFLTYANFWLTSLLSIVFCLKISNLHSRLFLYLRRKIEHRTVNFIVACGLFSIFNCLMLLMMSITELIRDGTYNTTMTNQSTNCTIYINFVYTYTVGTSIPLLFSCISSVLLFTTLYHHTTKMKMSRNVSIHLETYYSAMKFISFTFIYNTLYFIGHFVGAFYYYFNCVNLYWLYITLDFLPVLHSCYLIYRTAKLRSHMSKVL
ncbi:hypothetical protein GDO78_022176, partial [Eleutherodactylus coqui]